MQNALADAENALCFLHDPGAVFELCVIGPQKPTCDLWEDRANGKKNTISGWYQDAEAAAIIAGKISEKIKAEGIYTTLNSCKKAYLARSNHRLKASFPRTEDKHIESYRNLLIDIDTDPGGVSGVSSTNEEHEAALQMAQIIKADLTKEGWPESMDGDSGNGGHLIYPLDLPNTEENKKLLKSVLEALAHRFKDELARRNLGIDTAVYNPARLTKLYGTWVRKGDSTKDRPHRIARLLSLPEKRQPISLELLKKMAASAPKENKSSKTTNAPDDSARLDVAAFAQHYGVEVVQIKPHGDALLYLLKRCVFDESHTRKEAYIGQAANGSLFYGCKHNSCQGRTWPEARQIISGEDKLTSFMIDGPPHYRERKFSISTGVCGDLEKAIRGGTFTPEQKAYLIELIKKSAPKRSIAEEVREWVMTSSGLFLTSECFIELGLTSSDFKKAASLELLRLKKKGVIESCGEKRGCYRLVDTEAQEIPWKEVGIPIPVDLKLPLDLHELVDTYSGNIIVVGGTYNAGKTCCLLNIARLNKENWHINYLSSEMTPEELAARLYKFVRAGLIPNIDAWDKVKFRQRRENFHQVIDPDGLNIIDYLELNKEFYAVGGMIDLIFQKLNKGIAVIAIQKAPGEIHARGGAFTVEKARFAVSIDFEKLKIIKAKNLKPGVKNPTNTVIDFQITDGGTRMERLRP